MYICVSGLNMYLYMYIDVIYCKILVDILQSFNSECSWNKFCLSLSNTVYLKVTEESFILFN